METVNERRDYAIVNMIKDTANSLQPLVSEKIANHCKSLRDASYLLRKRAKAPSSLIKRVDQLNACDSLLRHCSAVWLNDLVAEVGSILDTVSEEPENFNSECDTSATAVSNTEHSRIDLSDSPSTSTDAADETPITETSNQGASSVTCEMFDIYSDRAEENDGESIDAMHSFSDHLDNNFVFVTMASLNKIAACSTRVFDILSSDLDHLFTSPQETDQPLACISECEQTDPFL